MAVSLETRVPFLDHRVAELAARIPLGLKVRGGGGKHILRKLLYRLVPRELFERPKAGFAVPVGEWIKGPLRALGRGSARSRRGSRRRAGSTPTSCRRAGAQHLSGRRDLTPALWAILMFQSWLAAQGSGTSTATGGHPAKALSA